MAEEEVHLPPLTLLQQTSLVLAQLGELPCGAAAAELTCISEEGIADMDIPDHLLEELDFAADCITSCDKVLPFYNYFVVRFLLIYINQFYLNQPRWRII